MKSIKTALYLITIFLASITLVISLGSAFCKFSLIPKSSLIEGCGYVAFYWISGLSIIVLVLFVLLRHFRTSLCYLTLMFVFTVLLNDYSCDFINNKKPKDLLSYDKLKVIAYNVKYYSFGLDNIIKFIQESDFDMVLLSESVLSPGNLEYLRNKLKDYFIITDNGNDLSLLSRYPVVSFKILELPTFMASLSGGNDIEKLQQAAAHRSFIHAVVNFKGTPVNILSVRLIAGRPKDNSLAENIRWGHYLIDAQNEEISVFLNYVNMLKGPVIFGGDLNVLPNTTIVHEIKQCAQDAYLEKHAFGSFTFKAPHPNRRLDYLFNSRDVLVENSRIVNCALSDHLPVEAEFLIRMNSAQSMK